MLNLVVVFGAYPITILFGVPAYLVLKRRVRLKFLTICLVGGVIAAAPWLLLTLFTNPDYAMIGDRVTVQNGHKTWFGWIEILRFLGECFIFGAIGGAVFWALAIFKWRPPQAPPSSQSNKI